MSSEAAHFLVGAALALPALRYRELTSIMPAWAIPVSSGLVATIPDLDLVWKHIFGPTHNDLLVHRGLFHSPFFLLLLSCVLAAIATRGHTRNAFTGLWLLWAICMMTHPLLDAMTTGGNGVMLLLPFTAARFHFPWRHLQMASPHGSLFSRAWFLRPSEIPFCVIALAIGVIGFVISSVVPENGPYRVRR